MGVRSWFGVARDLVARVVDKGLHLPEAAQLLRSAARTSPLREPPPPLPTVTLAEIYAAQGYQTKALAVLDEVLQADADNTEARGLRGRLQAEGRREPKQAAAEPPTTPEPPAEPPAEPEPPAAPPAEPPTEKAAEPEPPAAPPAAPPAEPPTEKAAEPARRARPRGVDELVALATDSASVYACWELEPVRMARARWDDREGQLVLRVLRAEPAAEHSRLTIVDIAIDELDGDRVVRGFAPGAEVRLCVGWSGAGGFRPLIVAAGLRIPAEDATQAAREVQAAPLPRRAGQGTGAAAQIVDLSLLAGPDNRAANTASVRS
jgi:hypothetical protein